MHDFLSKPSDKLSKSDIKQLQELHQKEFGETFCGSCQGEILEAFKKIKSLYMITDFELKGLNPYYRLEKGKPGTISNSQMSNKLALQFLSIDPTRIKLFSKYPEDWREQIGEKTSFSQSTGKHERENSKEVTREELEAKKYNELAKAYPDHFKIGMKKMELIDKILG